MVEGLASPFASVLTLTLLHFLWQGSLIALGTSALLKSRVVRSARERYTASLLALSIMALCPLVTFAIIDSSGTCFQEPAGPLGGAQLSYPFTARAALRTTGEAAVAAADRPVPSELVSCRGATATRDGALAEPRSIFRAAQPYMLLLWLAGVMLGGLRRTAALLTVTWLRFGQGSICPELAGRCGVLARRLGLRTARVFASTRIQAAAVVGFWRPTILIPASWLTSLPVDVLEAVIAHELAHIRRLDVWVNLLQRLLETLLFYHPAVWWLSNRVRLEREMCCDDAAIAVIGKRARYATALEQVATLQVHGTPSLATAFNGGKDMNLLRRIHHILGTSPAIPGRGSPWSVVILVTSITLIAFGLGEREHGPEAVAQDRGARPSLEGESEPRAAAREGGAANEESAPRRADEGDRRPSAEEEGRRSPSGETAGGLEGFRPETPREEALLRIIRELQREVQQLRLEIRGLAAEGGEGEPRREGGDREGVRERDPVRDGDRDGVEGSQVSGIFKGHDTAMDTVTVSIRGGEGEGGTRERVLTLGGNAEIIVDGDKGKLAQLGDDCSVRIWLEEGSEDRIRRLEALGRRIGSRRGVRLRRLDPAKRTLTLRVENSRLDKTYTIAADVRVVLDGKPARLGDLSLERGVYLQLAADMETVIAVQQGDPERERRRLEQERRIFRNVDKDSDGKLSFEEYFALSEGRDARSRARWRSMFERGDRDGDEAWSRNEFIAARTGRNVGDLEEGGGRSRPDRGREGLEGGASRDGDRGRE